MPSCLAAASANTFSPQKCDGKESTCHCNTIAFINLQSWFVFVQNRLASTRTDLGGKACTVTEPAPKPRAALGEVGNIAINRDPQKKVTCFLLLKGNQKG